MRVSPLMTRALPVAVASAAALSACSLLISTGGLAGTESLDASDASEASNASDSRAPEAGDEESSTPGPGLPGIRCQRADATEIQCRPEEACCVVFGKNPNYCLDSPDAAACADPLAPVALLLCDDDKDCAVGSVCCASPGASAELGNAGCVAGAICSPPMLHLCDVRVGCGASKCVGIEAGFYGTCQ